MTAKEFATIASAIKAAWPAANIMPDKQSKEVWYTMLSDLDYLICLNAIKQLICTNKFAPTISEIRECCSSTQVIEMDWGSAWEEVLKAIRYFGYYRPEEAMQSLSPEVRASVKRLGFQNLCLSENPMADRANFRMIFEQTQKVDRMNRQLPKNLLEEKQKIQQWCAQTVKALEGK